MRKEIFKIMKLTVHKQQLHRIVGVYNCILNCFLCNFVWCDPGDNRRRQPSREREGLRSRCGEDGTEGQRANVLHCGLQRGWTGWDTALIQHHSCFMSFILLLSPNSRITSITWCPAAQKDSPKDLDPVQTKDWRRNELKQTTTCNVPFCDIVKSWRLTGSDHDALVHHL